jgi:glyoxylase-like metal-dependent hydrolase (beta-lactamase superfamily II)
MPTRLVPVFCPYGESGVMAYALAAGQPTLIDTGGPQHPRAEVAAGLAERGLSLDDIRLIVNTHGHWDHAGGNRAAHDATGGRAEVWIHEAGAALLTDAEPHLAGYYGDAARYLERPDLSRALQTDIQTQFEAGPAASKRFVDGDRLDLDESVVFDVLHVPGHSADHCALYWEQEGILIAGDSAQGTGSRRGGCPLYFGSIAEARASIHRLMAVPFRTLHVSHRFGRPGREERPTTHEGDEGQAFLADSLVVLDAMEEALAEAYRESPAAPYPELAKLAAATLEHAGHWPILADQTTGLPAGAAVTFYRLGVHLGYW